MPLFNSKTNDELEALRNSIRPCNHNEETINYLIKKTKKIHVGFLFETEAFLKLCTYMSSTQKTLYHNGWDMLGIHLGIDPVILKVIQHSFHSEDPTYYTILTYSRRPEATISKIIASLSKIERYDVITQMKEPLLNLIKKIENEYCIQRDDDDSVIQPKYIPPVPFVLSSVFDRENRLNSRFQEPRADLTGNNIERKCKQYSKIVMLTFASDGIELADKLAHELRKKYTECGRIGVLILQEHSDKVYSNAENFIYNSFCQVDYIIPIITKKYLKNIYSVQFQNESGLKCLDEKYINYIYMLMNTNLTNNSCVNAKVRCVIPDNEIKSILLNSVMGNLVFQVWFRSSEIENFAEYILKGKI